MVLHYSSLRKLIHHTVDYIHHKKRNNVSIYYNINNPYKKQNKPDTRGQIVNDSTYMKYLKETNL